MKKAGYFLSYGLLSLFLLAFNTNVFSFNVTSPTAASIWGVGTTHNITWEATTGPYTIELWDGAGLVGTTALATGVVGTTYPWTIDASLNGGTDYYIKITNSEATPVISSSATFTIAKISINTPASGASWGAGTTQEINWAAAHTTGSFDVTLWTALGVFVRNIDITGTTSPKSWTIPADLTPGSYKIKVVDHTVAPNVPIEGLSSSFNIVGVTYPTASSQLVRGKHYTIAWSGIGDFTTPVKLEYNIGAGPVLITASTAGPTYDWKLPIADNNVTCYIIVTSLATPTTIAQSPVFHVNYMPYVYLTSPVSTDTWEAGSNHAITWVDNLSSYVTIDLYNFNGTSLIQTFGGSSGTSYNWNIPADFTIDPAGYRIKVSNSSDPTNTYYMDDAPFHLGANSALIDDHTINPGLAAGQTFMRGNLIAINWVKHFPENVNVYLVNGADILANRTRISAMAYGNTANWFIPDDQAIGDNYSIKVISVLYDDGTGGGGTLGKYRLSNNTFRITAHGGGAGGQTLTFSAPAQAGGTIWQRNSLKQITWTKNNVPENVDLSYRYYTAGLPGAWQSICPNIYGGAYNWFIANDMAIGNYDLKIVAHNEIPTTQIVNFDITDVNGGGVGGAVLVLTSPGVGTDTWQTGTLHAISWTKNFPQNVKVEFCTSGGATITTIMDAVYGTSYNWFIPNDGTIQRGDYIIKVTKVDEPGISVSHHFTINGPGVGTVALTQPNAPNIIIPRGAIYHQIAWTPGAGLVDNFQIELWKGGILISILKTNESGVNCDWYVPNYLEAGSDYQIRIRSASDPTNIKDESALPFTIAIYKSFNVFPNPSDNGFSVNLDESAKGNYEMVVYNRLGLKVLTSTLNADASKELSVSTASLPNGVYYVVLTSDGDRITKSVVVQH